MIYNQYLEVIPDIVAVPPVLESVYNVFRLLDKIIGKESVMGLLMQRFILFRFEITFKFFSVESQPLIELLNTIKPLASSVS